MDPRLFILTLLDDACRERNLDDLSSPTWNDGQFIRTSTLRFQRNDDSAWQEFLQRLDGDGRLTWAVRSILVDHFVLNEVPGTNSIVLNLPCNVTPLPDAETRSFLKLFRVWDRHHKVFPHPFAHFAPDTPYLYHTEDEKKFIPPAHESPGEIMYIEMKPGLTGPARIGRVRFSKTRKTLYYGDAKLQSLKGSVYKANYYDVETAMHYWISKCRQDGNDTLYPDTVEIDDDVREEYWTQIRKQPENKHLTKFRSPGKYSERRPS